MNREPLLSSRAGLKEANDIVLYLKPLRILLEEMEQTDFTVVRQPDRGHSEGLVSCLRGRGPPMPRGFLSWGARLPSALGSRPGGTPARLPSPCQLPTVIAKVLFTTGFIWATSEHYNTPSRIIIILQELCNLIIEMVALPLPVSPCPRGWRSRAVTRTQSGWHRGLRAPG